MPPKWNNGACSNGPLTKLVTLRQADSISPVDAGHRRAEPGFRPDIEGLRAVAVLGVVLFHADVPGVGGGYVGVDVFFVISGFLITGLLWREVSSTGTVRLRRFYGARARRLLPASATVGVVTAIASAALLPLLQAKTVMGDGVASALYVANYRFIVQGVDYLAANLPPSPFQHYWTLGVEEQFYLVWPAMMIGTAWLIRRARRRTRARAAQGPYLAVLVLVGVVSFAMSLVVTYVTLPVAFFSLPTRAWQLAAGGLVAVTAGRWRRLPALPAAIVGWAGLALILLACTLFGTNTLYPGTAALLPVLGTVLVIGAGCAAASRGCGRVLSVPPMRAIGRVSYSWYLWHWPVLVLAPPLLGHPLGPAGKLATVVISAGLAVLTLHLIENPLRFAAPLRRSPRRSLALGGAATAVAVCVSLALLVSVPTPVGRGEPASALTVTVPRTGHNVDAYDAAVRDVFGQVQAAVAASAGLKAVPSNLNPPLADAAAELRALLLNGCLLRAFQISQVRQPECATGDTASTTTVALVGDSHAAMWAPAFQRLAEQRHWRLETLTKGACPLLNLPIANPLRRWVTHCEQWRDEVLDRLRAERPRLVVVDMARGYRADQSWQPGFTSYDRVWFDSLTRLAQQLRDTGAKVLVLGPVPSQQAAVPICLSGHLDDATACASPSATAVNEPGIAAETAAAHAGGAQYADLTELFCTAERCPVIVGNTLVYLEGGHITGEYARLLAPVMGVLADRALAAG
ncbi:acyltransferase family protein [Mycobacterium sp. 663a-19]|uniref:acyltransferase family protein n=1 Tax=Mycobacterium sp. 663a-19 TaxID=2986148 RepID=UPI002D1F394A|nr:acyltransferase family protein [Mycobacterium sp. 663a-19]MEB3981994.1 acyltransferase family protein [Mycobacterium sp. 663a-19]